MTLRRWYINNRNRKSLHGIHTQTQTAILKRLERVSDGATNTEKTDAPRPVTDGKYHGCYHEPRCKEDIS